MPKKNPAGVQSPVIPTSLPADPTPQPKVIAAATAAAVTTVLAWALRQAGLDISGEVQGAFTVLFTGLAGYFTSSR